jgi:hypothetical protein
MYIRKKGIALLITLFFIMAITVSIGIGLKYVNNASNEVESEDFLFQTGVIVDDILTLLKNSKELETVVKESSAEGLFIFLSQATFIPLENSGLKIGLEINNARAKFNPNRLIDNSKSIDVKKVNALREYMNRYMVNDAYIDILLDNMRGIKEDLSYTTDIFYDKPYLFRDYITSYKHLDEINDFYIKTYHEDSLKKVDFDNLFYLSSVRDTAIDLNYATTQVWELILSVDKQRAEQLTQGGGSYVDIKSLVLSEEEQRALSRFKVSYFEPYLDVIVKITQNDKSANIRFEYDMKNKKGSNFSYEI